MSATLISFVTCYSSLKVHHRKNQFQVVFSDPNDRKRCGCMICRIASNGSIFTINVACQGRTIFINTHIRYFIWSHLIKYTANAIYLWHSQTMHSYWLCIIDISRFNRRVLIHLWDLPFKFQLNFCLHTYCNIEIRSFWERLEK